MYTWPQLTTKVLHMLKYYIATEFFFSLCHSATTMTKASKVWSALEYGICGAQSAMVM